MARTTELTLNSGGEKKSDKRPLFDLLCLLIPLSLLLEGLWCLVGGGLNWEGANTSDPNGLTLSGVGVVISVGWIILMAMLVVSVVPPKVVR